MTDFDFSNRVIAVTGGASGIGQTIAVEFARRGANIAVCDRASLEHTTAELRAAGIEALAVPVDVSHRPEVDRFVAAAVERFGRLDVAVCCAGVRSRIPFEALGRDEWHRVMDINLLGTFYTCAAALRPMKESRSGRIVTISSLAGQVGGTLVNVAYSATKAGIIALTKVAAKEAAPFNVTVNSIAPGTIDTPFIGDYDESLRERLQSLIPLGRLGRAEDVAGAALFLASDFADWITGTTVSVSGGQVMQ
jgi:NAD(P)-dependent dehydrogenase (short-subunit alcohol dehydrogenase family)